jgi:hypothetical protein
MQRRAHVCLIQRFFNTGSGAQRWALSGLGGWGVAVGATGCYVLERRSVFLFKATDNR